MSPLCPQGYFRGGFFFPKMVETLQLLYQADICSLTVYLVRPQREGERGRERAALFPAYIHPSPPPPPSPSIFIYQFSELRRRPFPIASEPPFEFGHQNRTAHFHTWWGGVTHCALKKRGRYPYGAFPSFMHLCSSYLRLRIHAALWMQLAFYMECKRESHYSLQFSPEVSHLGLEDAHIWQLRSHMLCLGSVWFLVVVGKSKNWRTSHLRLDSHAETF